MSARTVTEMAPLGSVMKAPSVVKGGPAAYWVVAADPVCLAWLALRSDENGEILSPLTSGTITYESIMDKKIERVGDCPGNVSAFLGALAERSRKAEAAIERAFVFAADYGVRTEFAAAMISEKETP